MELKKEEIDPKNETKRSSTVRRFSVFTVVTFIVVLTLCKLSKRSLPGHLQPFGKSGENILVDIVDGFPKTADFIDQFGDMYKPVLMKGAIKDSEAFLRWTDEYLLNLTRTDPTFVFIEPMKKEIRGDYSRFISLQTFLKVYKHSDIYIVDNIPDSMAPDVLVPCPLQCQTLLQNQMEQMMWFSSGGTKSVVHTDDYENILCSVRGHKHLTMIDPDQYGLENFPFKNDGSMPVDVDSVDLEEYPIFSQVEFVIADLSPGDCLYIPYNWIHQVNSYGSNIGLNFWWDVETTEDVSVNKKCHSHLKCDLNLHLSDIKVMNIEDTDVCPGLDFLGYQKTDNLSDFMCFD